MATPIYRHTDDDRSSAEDKHVLEEAPVAATFQRPHRAPGQLELGATEIVEGRYGMQRQVAQSAGISNSQFRHVWDQRRPEWVGALVAEFFGVFFYCISGMMSTAVYVFTQGKTGSLEQIGFAYALGITFAVMVCASTSGGHFHPAMTIAQVLFKGFPARKAPFYIFAQILGGFVASLVVYSIWRNEMLGMTELLTAQGERAVVFSPDGPAGIIAIFPTPGRTYGELFASEWFGDMLLGLVIWSQLDAQNVFASPHLAPYTIGLAFAVVVWGWAPSTIVTNTARDIGSRFACGAIWGRECFPSKYTALAALTNIPATIFGVAIYTFFLSDTRRPPANVALEHLIREEHERHVMSQDMHDDLLDKRIAQVVSRGADPSALQAMKSRQS